MLYSSIASKMVQPTGSRPNTAPWTNDHAGHLERHAVDEPREQDGDDGPGGPGPARQPAPADEQVEEHEDRQGGDQRRRDSMHDGGKLDAANDRRDDGPNHKGNDRGRDDSGQGRQLPAVDEDQDAEHQDGRDKSGDDGVAGGGVEVLDVRDSQRHGWCPAGWRVCGSAKGVIVTGCCGEAKGLRGKVGWRGRRRRGMRRSER